jgi:hypothetical protein
VFLHSSLFFYAKTIAFPVKKGYHGCRRKQKAASAPDADPQRPRNGKEHRFMKNWKKLLACLLVGLMALTVFTACDASVGKPMGPERSDAESAKALCEHFENMDYSEELSEKAYSIANWVAGTSVSCNTSKDKTEFYRVVKANNEARAFLKEKNYATAFENLSMGVFGLNDFVPGFEIETEWSLKDDTIRFTLPKDGSVTETMTKAAEGKTKLGVAYVVKDRVSYAVVLFG